MRTRSLKAALMLLVAVVLLALPVAAYNPEVQTGEPRVVSDANPDRDPSRQQPVEVQEQIGEAVLPQTDDTTLDSVPAPAWVPSSAKSGFYAARDTRNLNPTEYNLAGGHRSFYWDELEPTEGNYQWFKIDNFITSQTALGKKVGLGIITFNGRANEGNVSDPPIRTPNWVFAAGARKVSCSPGDGQTAPFEIPRFWDSVYKTKYRSFISALAARYDGNANIEFIQIGVGKFGETQPCDDRDEACMSAALAADGYTDFTWPYIVNDITDIYADYFHQTRLLLPNAPRFMNECDRRTFTDEAIARGVGLFPAGIYPDLEWVDLRTYRSGSWNGCGKYDRIIDQVEAGSVNQWVPLAFEMYHYMTPDPTSFYWGVLAALGRHADYVTLERDVLYDGSPGDPTVAPITANINVLGWAGPYMGKHVDQTPSAWVALRDTGYIASYNAQKGNYEWWIKQDDTIAQGRTVLTTYRSRSQLINAWSPLDSARTDIETDQAFLASGREGWITRRTDQATSNRYMWFKIDDRFTGSSLTEATITVTYFDRGTDTWQLAYDAVGNAYRVAGTVTKTNTNTWKKAVFSVPDAWFGNMQLGGADFRIDCMADGNEYIHMVDVRKGAGGEVHQINLTNQNGGWNFVSERLIPPSTAVADVFASIAGKFDIVQAYVNGAWKSYTPGYGGELTTADQKMGLWIHVTQDCAWSVSGEAPTSTTIRLSAANGGWNLIGWPSDNAVSIETALAGIVANYTMVYYYDAYNAADPWKVYNRTAPSYANDLTQLSSGKAYWIRVTADCDLIVNY